MKDDVIALTGSTGFLGSALRVTFARSGLKTLTIGRSRDNDIRVDLQRDTLTASQLAGASAVIHLAGARIDRRWTPRVRAAIRDSRIRGTRAVASAAARASPRPRVMLSASAIGIYGNRGDELLDEASATGDDFLAEMVADWERATQPAQDAGIRVVHMRTGLVLSGDGGLLRRVVLPFRLGLGGPLGSGTQWMSWIALDDWVRAVVALLDGDISGPVNLVSPNAVTNAEFTRELGAALSRPTVLSVPGFALKAVFGEMAEATILASQRVAPARLQAAGFEFRFPLLRAALDDAVS